VVWYDSPCFRKESHLSRIRTWGGVDQSVIYHILHVCVNTDGVEQELRTIFALNTDHGIPTVILLDLDVWPILRISKQSIPLCPWSLCISWRSRLSIWVLSVAYSILHLADCSSQSPFITLDNCSFMRSSLDWLWMGQSVFVSFK
jgi:hypothetical protein